MNRPAQALVLTAIGAVALRVGITEEYANYVNEWMRWPLVVSGVLLLGLAVTAVLSRDGHQGGHEDQDEDEHDGHRTTSAAWALLVPVVVAFVVQPQALGGYVADRRVNDVAAVSYDEAAFSSLSKDQTHDMLVSEFVALAATYGEVVTDVEVRLTGFVTRDEDGWYVTRVAIRCCAADGAAFRVKVEPGPDTGSEPAEGEWLEVTGTWVEGTGTLDDDSGQPAITATGLTPVEAPTPPYE